MREFELAFRGEDCGAECCDDDGGDLHVEADVVDGSFGGIGDGQMVVWVLNWRKGRQQSDL